MFRSFKQINKLYKYWKKHPISSKDIGGTFRRFVRWQISSRLLNYPVIISWIGNTKLVMKKGMTGATMNFYSGLHEFYDMAFLLHFLRADDCFVDIGANIGSYTILASGYVGARSISIEPIPATFQNLLTNIVVNNLQDKVQPECCGIGSLSNDKLLFIADQDTTNRVAPVNYKGTILEVPIKALDILLEDVKSLFWKIDVEGFEEQVLAGATKVLKLQDLMAVQIENNNSNIKEIMLDNGFALYSYDPFFRKLTPLKNKISHNYLWIRNEEFVAKRCKTANKVQIRKISF